MRLIELLRESTDQTDILNSVEELIVRLKAREMTKVKTPAILAKLKSAGYVIDMASLVDLLNKIESVGSANGVETVLDTALPDSPKQKDDQTVSKLASKQLNKKDRKL